MIQNAVMDITDNGPKPNAFSIKRATTENADFRRVAWTGKHLQVTLMSIEPGAAVGLEVHHGIDQFLRIDAGKGRVKMGPAKDDLSFQRGVEGGWSIQVPAGMWRDVENIGEEPLRLYAVYAPAHPVQGIVQETPEDEEKGEVQGREEPPPWAEEIDSKGAETAMAAVVDTTFDVRSDSRVGADPHQSKDPDRYSPTLRRYHQLLWSKELPTGGRFDLAPEPGAHLVHRSSRGVFFLASDAFTTRLGKRAGRVIREIPDDELPEWPGYTIGSAMVFPANRVDGMMTINGARGFLAKIADRPDLTLECIRRHYLGEQPNPLAAVLLRYKDFFDLFGDFRGYVEFFLLQDLVEDDGQTIRFFHPFANFKTPAVPKNKDEYLRYLQNSNDFIRARNRRIDAYMALTDNGPTPKAFSIERATKENADYRRVVWTGKHLQVTLMSIEPGSAIGLEVHHGTDQFLRIDAGKGRVKMGPAKDDLSFQEDVKDGWSIQVPAGTWHDVENTGDEPLRLYTIYAPTHHAQGIVQETPEDAEKDEEQGIDQPPSWVEEVDDKGEETA